MNLRDMIFSYDRFHPMPAGGKFHRTFAGFWCQHSWAALFVYEKFLAAHHDVDLFVELGSGFGGLSSYLALTMQERYGRFVTVELDSNRIRRPDLLALLNAEAIEADIMEDRVVALVRDRILTSKRTIILVDGGDKPKEMALYGPLLGKNDMIVCHDWGVEVAEKDIPAGWEKYQPWQEQAEEMGTHQLILKRTR